MFDNNAPQEKILKIIPIFGKCPPYGGHMGAPHNFLAMGGISKTKIFGFTKIMWGGGIYASPFMGGIPFYFVRKPIIKIII